MKLLLLVLFILVACEPSDDNITDAVNDSFSNNPKPSDVQISPICYEDYHKIESENVNRKLDILIVPDTSGSIKEERSKIAKGFHNLINSLPNAVDYNIGVMLAHSPQSNWSGKLYKKNNEPRVLKSSELSIDQIKAHLDTKIFNPKTEGQTDGGEVGMLSILEGLTPANVVQMRSEGFLRSDASLAVVFIADEQDICAKMPEGVTAVVDRQNAEKKTFVKYCIEEDIRWQDVVVGGRDYTYKVTPELVIQKIKEVHGERPLVIGGVLYDENSVIPTGNEDEIAYGLLDIIRLADGINVRLDNGDYGDGLSKLGRLATATMDFQNNFAVKNKYVDPLTLKATVDNEVVSAFYDFELEKIFIDPDFDKLGTVKINYCSDSTLPTISINETEITGSANYILTGNSDDLYYSKHLIYLNNTFVAESNNKEINQALTLSEGNNTIRIEVLDLIGNKKIAETDIILDTIAPKISLGNLSESYSSSNEFTLFGSVEEENLDKIEIYLNDVLYKTTDKIDEVITLNQVSNSIRVKAIDKVGLTDELSISVTVDNTPPIINLISEGGLTNDPNFSLNLDIVEENLDKIEVLNNGISQAGLNFILTEGENVIEIRVYDLANNESNTVTLTMTLDTTPPVLSAFTPANNSTLRTTIHTLSAVSNEELSKVLINGSEITLTDNMSISQNRVEQGEGDVSLSIQAFDKLGNSSTYTLNYEVFLKLIRIDLVTLIGHNGKINVIGKEGAALEGLKIDLSGGFFNNTEVIANQDGSFEAELNFTSSVSIEAIDERLNLDESYSIEYKADTTLSGMVKDVDDTPIPGVTVTIASTGQKTTTDSNGVFSIPDPATGDQRIIIDGNTVPDEFLMDKKKYSSVSINYSVGFKERNAMERVIYLAPILMDGTETEVISGVATTVTSIHAPGVRLDIPANATNFPSGVPQVINMMEIPLDKTSIEVFEGARPETVYALEPSGLTFTNPVPLTLPNPNGFVEGQKLVIMSKNSTTGLWEIDGAATVENNEIVTTDGDGITHFSEVFAAPYGLDVEPMVSESRVTPGFNTDKGSLTTQVRLPSYKTFGEDFTPNFIYKSKWANPNVIVSNIFNLSQFQIFRDRQRQGGFVSSASVNSTTRVWTTPDYIRSRFTISDIDTGEFDILAPNAPKQGIVSYAMDLESLGSDNYFARSSYEIKYRTYIQSTTRVRTRGLFGKKTKWIRNDQTLFDTVFPPDLESRVLVQNKKNSEYGAGWKLGLTQDILNPNSDKILIEEADGKTSSYILDNAIETVVQDDLGIRAFSTNSFGISYLNNKSELYEVDELDNKILKTNIPTYDIKLAANSSAGKYRNRTTNCGGSGPFGGQLCLTFDNWDVTWFRSLYSINKPKRVSSFFENGSNLVYLDSEGAFFSNNGAENLLVGKYQLPPVFDFLSLSEEPNALFDQFCKDNTDFICDESQLDASSNSGTCNYFRIVNGTNTFPYSHALIPCTDPVGNQVNIAPLKLSEGQIPLNGYSSGSLSNSALNNPLDFIPSKTEGNVYYIADTGNNLIRRVSIGDGLVTDIAGDRGTIDPIDVASGVDATSISIYHPRGIVSDSSGRLYVSLENGLIRRIDANGKIYTVAGGNRQGAPVEKNTLDKLNLNVPSGMVLDEDNAYLYVADTKNHRVVRLDLNNNESTQMAGNNFCQSGVEHVRDGDPALSVSICNPEKIALDQNKNLLILDKANNRIRRVNLNSVGSGLKLYKPIAQDNTKLYKKADGTFERIYRDNSVVKYNEFGKQVQSIDKNENQFDFTYTDNLLTEITDYTGRKTTLTYVDGLLDTFTDPTGKMTVFSYLDNKLSEVRFSDGSTRRFSYTDRGEITEEYNQRGFRQAYEYNQWNRLAKVIAPDGGETSVGETITQSLANDLGNQGELVNFENEQDESELGKIFQDANGVETSVREDFDGFITKIIDGDGRETNIERDFQGRPLKITKNDGSFTTFEYNVQGDLIEKYDSSINKTEEYTYNEYGYPVLVKDVSQKEKSFTYDDSGNLLSETDPNNLTTSKTYFDNGLVKTATNALNQTTSFEYGADGNLSKRISPMGEVTEYIRDNSGNITQKIDPNLVSTFYGYDDFNRLIRVETGVTGSNPIGDITSYNYDLGGNLTKIIDPHGNETTFEYDSNDRLIRKVSPLGQVYTMDYDLKGNLVTEIDPNGNEKTYKYDNLDRVIEKVLPDNVYNIVYDTNDNITSISDSDSNIVYTYEKIGSEYYVTSETSNGTTINYEFNDEGIKKQTLTPYGNFSYSHDNGNRLVGITNHKGESFGFSYDSANRLKSISRPGSVTTLGVDNNGFLTSIDHMKGSIPISQFTYTRDALGNRIGMNTSFGNKNWSYDSKNQLKAATNSEASADYLNEVFEYDNLGNRINSSFGGSSYDPKKRRLMENHKYVFAYDNNGNMTIQQEKGLSGNFKNFTYSSENQLIKVEEYESNVLIKTSEYFFDAIGRRQSKQVANHTDSVKSFYRRYVYDQQEILAEHDENNLLAVYTHSNLRTDDVLAVDVKDTTLGNIQSYFYLKDAIGSITEVVDSSGQLIQHYVYSSFGKILKIQNSGLADITSNPVLKTSYGFTNREHDNETGLMYYRARVYNPVIGRFLSEDPHLGEAMMPETVVNKYIYTVNNPVNFTDSSGRSIWDDLGKLGSYLTGWFTLGPLGQWASINYSGQFSEEEINIVNTMVITGASFGAGAIAGSSIGMSAGGGFVGGLYGAGAGLATGAVVGGVTGGTIEMLRGGSFNDGLEQGIVIGALAGASAGYSVASNWYSLSNGSAQLAWNTGCIASIGVTGFGVVTALAATTLAPFSGGLSYYALVATMGSTIGGGFIGIGSYCL